MMVVLAAAGTTAFAQLDGPAPLAWRWQQSAAVAPNGSPIVDGNVIYHNVGNRVWAIDRMTGNTVWKFPNGAPLDGTVKRSPVLINGVLVIYTDQKKVYGIDQQSGQSKWVYEAPFQISSPLVAVGRNVAFGMDGGNIMTVDAATGEGYKEGPVRILDGIGGPLYSDGRDAIVFFDNRSGIRAISATTRNTIWSQQFGARPADGVMTYKNDSFYVFSGIYLVCMNALNGAPRWQQIMPETMAFAPAIGTNHILAVTRSGNAYAFDANSGVLRSKTGLPLLSQPLQQPTVAGSKFVVPLSNGSFQLIDPDKSTIDWQYYVRPMNEAARQPAAGGAGNGAPGRPGGAGPGGPGGLGGGGGAGLGGGGALGGGGGAGGAQQTDTTVYVIPAAAPAVVAGKTLLVPGYDASLLAFDIENGIDMTGPTIAQAWPSPGETVSALNGQEFIFKIEDETSGVKNSDLKFDIDGVPYNFEFGRDGYLICQISTAKKNKQLSDGRHTINITATDWMGNETKLSVSIRADITLAPISRAPSTNQPGGGGGLPGGGKGGGGGLGGGGFGGGDGR